MSLTLLNWLPSGIQKKTQASCLKTILPNQINLFGGNVLWDMNGKRRSTAAVAEGTVPIAQASFRLKLTTCNSISLKLQQSGMKIINIHQESSHLSQIRKRCGNANVVMNGQQKLQIEQS